jgi:pilus assembly protein CpaE
VKIIINRFSAQHAVSLEQIEKAIRLPVFLKIPNNYADVVRSGILGEPISPKHKSDFSAQLVKWASTIAGPALHLEQSAPKKSGFSLWK